MAGLAFDFNSKKSVEAILARTLLKFLPTFRVLQTCISKDAVTPSSTPAPINPFDPTPVSSAGWKIKAHSPH